jgi:hypothetical protein
MRILDSEVDLDANKYLLFTQYRLWFLLVILTALMDAVSTMVFMLRTGPHIETNILVKILGYTYGPIVGPLLGKLYQIFGVWVLSLFVPRLTRFVCLMVICFNTYAFVINLLIQH